MTAVLGRRPRRRRSPWGVDDLLRTLLVTGVGLGCSVAGWLLAEGERSLDDQLPWINLGVGGLVIAGFGLVGWLLRGRRAVGQRALDLLGEAPTKPTVASVDVSSDRGALVAGPGRRFFHRSTCSLAEDRAWPTGERERFEAAGLLPCGVCRP